MPKNRLQETIYTIMMVLVMVYAMICYNIATEMGSLTNKVFLIALGELPIMGAIGFVLDTFIAGPIAKKLAFSMVNPRTDRPIVIILAISTLSIWLMCPLMSLVATVLFKGAFGPELISVWIETTVKNFPMAFFWQLFAAGPLVRLIFGKLFAEKRAPEAVAE